MHDAGLNMCERDASSSTHRRGHLECVLSGPMAVQLGDAYVQSLRGLYAVVDDL